MSAPTLDEWIKEAGFERLRDQLSCHFEVYGVSELDDLLRMCLISIRQELEDNGWHARHTIALSKEELRDELERLREALRDAEYDFQRIHDANWDEHQMKRGIRQEYELLVKENEALRSRNKGLRLENKKLLREESLACERGNRLARECQNLREALELYANEDSWATAKGCAGDYITVDFYPDSGEPWKRAKEALKGDKT